MRIGNRGRDGLHRKNVFRPGGNWDCTQTWDFLSCYAHKKRPFAERTVFYSLSPGSDLEVYHQTSSRLRDSSGIAPDSLNGKHDALYYNHLFRFFKSFWRIFQKRAIFFRRVPFCNLYFAGNRLTYTWIFVYGTFQGYGEKYVEKILDPVERALRCPAVRL